MEYYKVPFAVNCNKSFLILIRQSLEDHLQKLKQGKITALKQSNVLNLIHIYQANLDSCIACRISLKDLLPEREHNLINLLQYRQLEDIKPFPNPTPKADEDLTPEEIIQMHLSSAASKLNKTLTSYLDRESRMEKLASIDKYLDAALANDAGPEAKIVRRIMLILSSKKALKDLFEGNADELAIQRRIIAKCIDYLRGKISATVANNIKNKVFEHTEVGLDQEVRIFTKAFCTELMHAFGNQILIIADNENVESEGELTQEQQIKLEALNEAQKRKKLLEPMLYETFILASERFKTLI